MRKAGVTSVAATVLAWAFLIASEAAGQATYCPRTYYGQWNGIHYYGCQKCTTGSGQCADFMLGFGLPVPYNGLWNCGTPCGMGTCTTVGGPSFLLAPMEATETDGELTPEPDPHVDLPLALTVDDAVPALQNFEVKYELEAGLSQKVKPRGYLKPIADKIKRDKGKSYWREDDLSEFQFEEKGEVLSDIEFKVGNRYFRGLHLRFEVDDRFLEIRIAHEMHNTDVAEEPADPNVNENLDVEAIGFKLTPDGGFVHRVRIGTTEFYDVVTRTEW